MKLYNYFRSSASFRVRIALEIKGIDYQYLPVHLGRGEQQNSEHLNRSPSRLVPVLETDEGAVIGQSLAILEYLEEQFPEPALLPSDRLERARVRAVANLIACEIHPLNNLRILKYLESPLGLDAAARGAWYRHWVRDGFEALERDLSRSPLKTFCHSDVPGLAECCLVPQVFNARRFDTDLAGLPRTMRIFDRCMELEPFRRAQPSECPDKE